MTDWQRIVTDHSAAIWRTAYRLLGNPEDAADCVQETFLAALGVWRRQEVRYWPGLLHRIAASKAIDCLRSRIRAAATTDEVWDEMIDNGPDPREQAEAWELVERLRAAIARLPKQQSEAFCLRYLAGLDYRRIARSMDVNLNTVGSLLHRAKEQLRRILLNAEIFG